MGTQFTSKRLGNISIFVTGKQQCSPGHSYSYIFEDRFLLHYIISGKGILKTCGKEYKLQKGNIFLISDKYSYYEADMKDPWNYIWINFSGDIANQFLTQVNLSSDNPIYTTTSPDVISKAFLDIISVTDSDNEFLVYSKLFYLLGKLQETNANNNIRIQPSPNSYVKQCIDFIHTNYYRQIGTSHICQFIGLEYSYLFRLFKKHMNTSPGQYLKNYRLNKAAYLLKNTDMNINEISFAVGYYDRAAFSKAFTSKFKTSPKKYRLLSVSL